VFPRVRAASQHLGEEPINMTILCDFFSIFGHKLTKEIGLQICTLPSPANQYMIRQKASTRSALAKNTKWCWGWGNVVFDISWEDICIKSAMDNNLDTCRAMPQVTDLSIDQVKAQLCLSWPWIWIKCAPLAITTITIGTPINRVVLYHYLDLVEVNLGYSAEEPLL
jgi:hypothetical protein